MTNTSRSNSNQSMKFGQLIGYNIRNIFLEKPYTKCGGETIPRPFSKKSLVQSFIKFIFIVCKVQDYQKILKLSSRPLAFT